MGRAVLSWKHEYTDRQDSRNMYVNQERKNEHITMSKNNPIKYRVVFFWCVKTDPQ